MRSELFERVIAKSLDRKSYKDGEVVHHKDIWDAFEEAKTYFQKYLLGKSFRTKDGKRIVITEKGFKELFFSISGAMSGGHGAAVGIYKERDDGDQYMYDVLSIVKSLDKVISDMTFDYYEPNKKRDRKPDVRKYDTYECDVVIDGEEREAKIRIEVPFGGPARYYFHYIEP